MFLALIILGILVVCFGSAPNPLPTQSPTAKGFTPTPSKMPTEMPTFASGWAKCNVNSPPGKTGDFIPYDFKAYAFPAASCVSYCSGGSTAAYTLVDSTTAAAMQKAPTTYVNLKVCTTDLCNNSPASTVCSSSTPSAPSPLPTQSPTAKGLTPTPSTVMSKPSPVPTQNPTVKSSTSAPSAASTTVTASMSLSGVSLTVWDDASKTAFQATVLQVLNLGTTASVVIVSVTSSSTISSRDLGLRRRLSTGVNVIFKVTTSQAGVTSTVIQTKLQSSVLTPPNSGGSNSFTTLLRQNCAGKSTVFSSAAATGVTFPAPTSAPSGPPTTNSGGDTSSSSGTASSSVQSGKDIAIGVVISFFILSVGGWFAWRHFNGPKAAFRQMNEPTDRHTNVELNRPSRSNTGGWGASDQIPAPMSGMHGVGLPIQARLSAGGY